MLTIYLLYLVVYMAVKQVGMNSCMMAAGPEKSTCSLDGKLNGGKPNCATVCGHNYVTTMLCLCSYIKMLLCTIPFSYKE